MYFENVEALLTMDGHGIYVWVAYGITLLTVVSLIAVPLARKRCRLQELRGFLRRAGES